MKTLVLFLLLAVPVHAGVNRYQFRPKDSSGNPTAKIPQFIVADTEAELPSTNVYEGDIAYAKDTDKLWKRTASAWAEADTGGGTTFSTSQRVLGRNTAGGGPAEEVTATQVLDWLGSTRGAILYRGASGWAILTPGTSGDVLTSNGAGADPTYQPPPGGGGGLSHAQVLTRASYGW